MNVSLKRQQRLWIIAITLAGAIGFVSVARAQQPDQPAPAQPQAEQGQQPSDETPPGAPQSDGQQAQQHDQQHNQDAKNDQQSQKPELGVRTARSQTRGVVIIDVRPGSTAERAGLRPGDYILAIEQQPIDSAEQLARLIREKSIGETVRVDVWRDGQNQQLTAQIQPVSQQSGDRNDERDRIGQTNRDADQQAAWIGVWLDQDRDSAPGSPDGQNAQEKQDQQGAILRRVFPSGPAARAGLRDGDRVTAINDKKIDGPQQLVDQVAAMKPGETAEFTLKRNDNEQKVKVAIGRRGDFVGFGMQSGQREGNDRGSGDFDSGSVPGHAMMLEQHRRFAQQHERIEQMIVELRDEIRQLRAELGKDKPRSAENQRENQSGDSGAKPAAP